MIGDEISKLRKDYYIIAKIHYVTSFLKSEKDKINLIKYQVDEFYDSKKSIKELMERADVVLTDNSGSTFEAIYVNIPVCVFCDNINKNKKENFDTTQFLLYKDGILPYTNKKNQIKSIINKTCTKEIIKKQEQWAKEYFYYPKDNIIDFVNIIENYLNDNINIRYYEMHNILKNDYYGKIGLINTLKNTNNDLLFKLNNSNIDIIKIIKENNVLKYKLNDYESGKLYKISKKYINL